MRAPAATRKHSAYYIYDGPGTSLSFAGVWKVEKWNQGKAAGEQRKRKRKQEISLIDDEEWDEVQVQGTSFGGHEDDYETDLRRMLGSAT